MEALASLTVIAFAGKLVSLVKFVSANEWRSAVTQLLVWLSGIIAVWLYVESGLGAGVAVGAMTLGDLNAAGIAVTGVAVGSAASVAYDFKVARDDGDSAQEPRLGGNQDVG